MSTSIKINNTKTKKANPEFALKKGGISMIEKKMSEMRDTLKKLTTPLESRHK